MSELVNIQETTTLIAEWIVEAVGAVGVSTEVLSEPSGLFESVELSRGGLVVAGQTQGDNYEARNREHRYSAGPNQGELLYPGAQVPEDPVFEPGLAVVTYHIGDSVEPQSSSLLGLDTEKSGHYLFKKAAGLWRGEFLSIRESGDNAHTEIRTYYTKKAAPINARNAAFIQSIPISFESARLRRISKAENFDKK